MTDSTALEVARAKLDELFQEMQSADQAKAMKRPATVAENAGPWPKTSMGAGAVTERDADNGCSSGMDPF